MPQHIRNVFLGLAVIILVMQNVDSRRSKHRHMAKINREQISNQTPDCNGGKKVTNQLLGMYIEGSLTIRPEMKCELWKKIKKQFDDNKCYCTEERCAGDCDSHCVNSLNAEEESTVIMNDVEEHSFRLKRSAEQGVKCGVLELLGGLAKDNVSQHVTNAKIGNITWSDVSKYLRKVGHKVLQSGSKEANAALPSIYEEIEEGIDKGEVEERTGINVDTVENYPNRYYKEHLHLVEELHMALNRLKSKVTLTEDNVTVSVNCFKELLTFMDNLHDLAVEGKKGHSWESVSLNVIFKKMRDVLDEKSNNVNMYYSTKPDAEKRLISFCHDQILKEYFKFVLQRHRMFQKLQMEQLQYTGTLYGMTDKQYDNMIKLLFKTYRMTMTNGDGTKKAAKVKHMLDRKTVENCLEEDDITAKNDCLDDLIDN